MEEFLKLWPVLHGEQGWMAAVAAWRGVVAVGVPLFNMKLQAWFTKLLSESPTVANSIVANKTYKLFALGFVMTLGIRLPSEASMLVHEAKEISGPKKDLPPFRPPLWIIGALLAAALGTSGCLVPKGSIAPGADPIVVQAEALAETAGDSMDAFVQWEFRNRAAAGPDVTAAADLVREFGPKYLRELKATTRTYKATRNQPNADATRAAIKTLQDLLEQARNYYQPQGTP